MTNKQVITDWLSVTQSIPTEPTIPSDEKYLLGLNLILEETTELAAAGTLATIQNFSESLMKQAMELQKLAVKVASEYGDGLEEEGKEVDQLAMRDALVDIEVVHGNFVAWAGMTEFFQKDFEEVMKSNFSKFDVDKGYAENKMAYYISNGTPCYMAEVLPPEGSENEEAKTRYIIMSSAPESYGKILKGSTYTKPALPCITEDEFLLRYEPLLNPYEDEASGVYDNMGFGKGEKELKLLEATPYTNIASIIEGENGSWNLVAGMQRVNQVCYVLTKYPVDDRNMDIEVWEADPSNNEEDLED